MDQVTMVPEKWRVLAKLEYGAAMASNNNMRFTTQFHPEKLILKKVIFY